MELPKLRETKFELEEYGVGDGMNKPQHPSLRGFHSFKLSVENCRITDVRMLYRILADQLKVETDIIEKIKKEEQGDVHPLQYGVKEFLENILTEMKKIEGIDDFGYYSIKAR